MTTNQMTAAASDKKYYRVYSNSHRASMLVLVEILDTRAHFGRVDVLIRAVGGIGEMWVYMDSLSKGDENSAE
jgi:hypothetical protein